MLPDDATPFIGRAMELAQLTALLSHARMITVTGTGGVGKTRLALRAAAQASSRFADGVHLVQLSTLNDPGLLPHTVASRFGLPVQDARSATDSLLDYLRDRKLLLILDTCEHLIDACAALTENVLEQTFGVTVLATSRQPLDVDGENACPISPLSVPQADGSPVPGDAVEFFAARAAAAAPGFTITADNRADVIRLCRGLDGIPLAIELAAARLRSVPLDELADHLEITQPLRDAIRWSYDLCTPAEQILWQRLSVFAGAFDSEAAKDVCSGRSLPAGDVLPAIVALVDKSVLVRDESGDDAERTRYRLLDMIREFGAERLGESGTQAGAEDRLISHYLEKARYFGEHFMDDDQLERYRELRLEHANVRAALKYTLENDGCQRARDGAELATCLYGYWMTSGLFQEGKYWLDKVVDRFPGPVPQRAKALIVRSYLGSLQGQAMRAMADARDGIRLATELGEQQTGARGYLYLNLALLFTGHLDEAAEAGAEAHRQFTALGDRDGLLCLDAQMGQLHQLTGNIGKALACYEDGLRLFGASRERWLHGYLHAMAALTLFFGKPGAETECETVAGEALRCKHELWDVPGIAYALEILGWVAARRDRYERAAWLLGAADGQWQLVGSRLSNAAALEGIHQSTIGQVIDRLGEERFGELFDDAAQRSLDQMVALALADADELPALPRWQAPAA
jgi:predicted ATPase